MEEGRENMEEAREKEEEKAVGREREKRERNEKRMEEQERRRRRRKRDVIWRGLDRENQEERRALLERFMKVVLERKAGIVDSTKVREE